MGRRDARASDSDTEMVADMLVGFKALREKFTSRVLKERPNRLEVDLHRRADARSRQRVALPRAAGRAAARSTSASISRSRTEMFEMLAGQYFDRAFRKMVARSKSARATSSTAAAARARRASPEGARRRGPRSSNSLHSASRLGRCRARRARTPRCRPASLAAAPGPGDAADRHRDVGLAALERAVRHRIDAGDRDRAEGVDDVLRDAEDLLLGLVRIGDEAAVEHRRRAGDLGDRGRDQPAGAAFRHRDRAAGRGVLLDHPAGERDDFLGQQRLGHARRADRPAAARDRRRRRRSPISVPATSGSIGAMTSITRSMRRQFLAAILARGLLHDQRIDQRAHGIVGQGGDQCRAARCRRPAWLAQNLSRPDLGARPDGGLQRA